MLVVTNPAKFKFVWPDGSPFVEVFRPGDPSEAPYEAVYMGNEPYNQGALNVLANESTEYAKRA